MVQDWERSTTRLFIVTLFFVFFLNLYREHIMRNARLDELQAGTKIAGRNINNLRWGWYHSNGRKWRGTKEILDEGGGEWKSWLKTKKKRNWDHGIQPHHFIANRREKGEHYKISSSWALKSLQIMTVVVKLEDDRFLAGKLWQICK